MTIDWTKDVFPVYRKEMKGIEWGLLYNRFKDAELDPIALEEQIKRLTMDDDVTNKKGIYTYVLTGEEKHLSIRAFSDSMKRQIYERQSGICPMCAAEANAKVTNVKVEFAPCVQQKPTQKYGELLKCMQIISSLGVRVDIPHWTMDKCFAVIIT